MDGSTAMSLSKWLEYATEQLTIFAKRDILVVTLIGKDSPNRSKGDEINDFLQYQAFPSWTDEDNMLSIDVFYSVCDETVFMVVNGVSDPANLESVLAASGTDFFEKLRDSEENYLRLLHLAFIVSHLVVFVEPAPRLDLSLINTLKTVNRIRLSGSRDLSDKLSMSPDLEETTWAKQGRISLPRIIFGFHRNVIRNELGQQKRREIYEKLEKSLEDQIYMVLKYSKIIENGTDSSLGYVPSESEQFAHLILPAIINHNPLADIIDLCNGRTAKQIEDKTPTSDSFSVFIRENMKLVRQDKHKSIFIPSLSEFVTGCKLVMEVLEPGNDLACESLLERLANKELKFMEELTDKHISDAVSQYTWAYSKERDRHVLTKAEHAMKFAAAVSYLDKVLVGNRESAMSRLRLACDKLWEGGMQGCEQQSVTGNNCNMPIHACIGDESVAESTWEMHDSGVTFISTCTCGRSQALRKDPFTLKEANYDFYHSNSLFTCCKGLERHQFIVIGDAEAETSTEKEENWLPVETWPRPGGDDANPVLAPVVSRGGRRREGSGRQKSSADSLETTDSETDTPDKSQYETDDTPDSQEDDISSLEEDADLEENELDEFRASRSYLDTDEKVMVKERTDNRREAAVELQQLTKTLAANKIAYLASVPHSLSPALPPLFPSWTLTCIGPSSAYSHSLGLRDQPNFKIACEYLLPVDVHLEVNPYNWERDMQCIQAMEGSPYARFRKPKRMSDTEKVKLFVGFDYECPRGHRFFIADDGNPLMLPKGHSAREAACRQAGVNILSSDLPLRRQCTCKKLPTQTAQLTKIHIVTPKAPVTVTLDPVVLLPNQEGHFSTGEGPLKLAWARYYILQLPYVYSGPSGLWVPPDTHDRVGTYKGNSIQVSYVPIGK